MPTLSSRAWDRIAIVAVALFSLASIGSVLAIFLTDRSAFAFPPGIGLVAFLPLTLLWSTSLRRTVRIGDDDITGLLWGARSLPFADIAGWRIEKSLLVVWPRDPRTVMRSPAWLQVRPGVPGNTLAVVLQPDVEAAASALLTSRIGPARDLR